MTVDEEFPFAFAAEVPDDMDVAEVEQIMAGIAKVDQEVDEQMPPMDTKASPSPTETGALPTVATPTTPAGRTPTTQPAASSREPAATPTAEPISATRSSFTATPTQTAAASATATAASQPTATPQPTPAPQPPPTQTPAPTPAPSESSSGAAKLKVGEFVDQDSFHRGSGTATIYRGPDGSLLLRLENLDVTNGPDLHVYLSPHPNPDRGGEVKAEGYVDLGKLKGEQGQPELPDTRWRRRCHPANRGDLLRAVLGRLQRSNTVGRRLGRYSVQRQRHW